MTNIYIKSFARPYYLERCIRSIQFNVSEKGRVIVLDDGTESAHLAKLRQMFPDVEFRSSGADDGKMLLLRQERFEDIRTRYPSAPEFWAREVGSDHDPYVFVMEDDAWVCRSFSLRRVAECMQGANMAILKFWWSHEKIATKRLQTFGNGLGIETVLADMNEWRDIQQLWIVAFAVFQREYYVGNVSKARRLADEASQLMGAFEYFQVHPDARVGITERRCVHQGWAVPGRSTPEYYDRGLRQHVIMDALSDAWLAGELDCREGYPYDFSQSYIYSVLKPRIPAKDLQIWLDWHSNDVKYLYDRSNA